MIDPEAFKAARKAKGYTQKTLAKALGVSWQLIGQYERGEVETSKQIFKIAALLDVPVTILDPDVLPENGLGMPMEVRLETWVSAGRPDLFEGDEPLGWVETTGLNPRGKWIALKVDGSSMDRISPPNSIIFVNLKDTRLVNNGCYVIDTGDGNTTYKRYRADPQRFEPVSTVDGHETIYFKNPPRIIGRVRRSQIEM